MTDPRITAIQAGRHEIIAASKILVIKIGSAVLAGHDSLDYGAISSLAAQIASLRGLADDPRRIIIVSSGAVAAGRAQLRSGGMEKAASSSCKHALAAVGQSLLMRAWSEVFAPHGITVAQVLLTRDDLRSRRRFQTAATTFADMLSWGVLPIVNENDTVSFSGMKFGDNDCLASLLVNLVEADLFINLTSAPGVLDSDPELNPNATVMDVIEDIGGLDIDSLCGESTALGSGGMRSKLLAARRVSQLGVPTLILPGKKEGALLAAFDGSSPATGTWVRPAGKSIPRRKFWLAYQSEPAGAVEVDDGAAEALLFRGGSLLPGGVTLVRGDFKKGDLLRIIHAGENIGVGFSNYSAESLAKIRGLKRHEVAAILGDARYPDVIHRDNLLLDAAI